MPRLDCHAIFGVAVALYSGSGPGFLLENQSNDGTGIVGIHDAIDAQPEIVTEIAAANAADPAARAKRRREERIIWRMFP